MAANTENKSVPLLIVNPRSASGATRDNWSSTASDFRAHFGAFNVAFTKAMGDGIEIARTAAEAGREMIIACGGDGTVNEVANGILQSRSECELGVLPSGTGGDFRRSLGLPRLNRAAAAALREGLTRKIDVGRVSFVGHDGERAERFFLNVSSAGLAATIIKRVKSSTGFDWLPMEGMRGRANFAISTMQEVLDSEPVTLRVRFDDGAEKTVQTLAFCVANARYFGGGMMIAPRANLNDGLLDIINIGSISAAKILLRGISLYRGTHDTLPEVKRTRAARIEVEAVAHDQHVLIETDGELPGRLPAVFEVIPRALRVRVPSSALQFL